VIGAKQAPNVHAPDAPSGRAALANTHPSTRRPVKCRADRHLIDGRPGPDPGRPPKT